jgi:RHS repeat-associated protein
VLSQHTTPTVVETYDYMPGACPEADEVGRRGEFMSGRITTSGTGTRPKFTGHDFDDETNLHTMQWRRQIPRYGVFRTPDPMADEYPGWNSYAYVMNDPMRYLDPTGLASCEAGFKGTCLPEVVKTADRYHGFLAYTYSFYANYYYDPNYTPTQNLSRDQFMTALDVTGTVDPTGIIDITSAVFYAIDGDIGNSLISAGSILPAGDLLKASRIATKGATKLIGPGTKFGAKIANQLTERGWTKALVQSTIDNPIRTVPWKDTRHLSGGGRMNDPALPIMDREVDTL